MCFEYFFKNKNKYILEHYNLLEHSNYSNDDECSICLEPLSKSIVIKMNGCKHYFHYQCLVNYAFYLKKLDKNYYKCPNCKSNQIKFFELLINSTNL